MVSVLERATDIHRIICVNQLDTFGTGSAPDATLAELVALKFDLRPAAMIERLELRTPLFERTARDGHVGHADLPWEHENEIDPKTEFLKSVAERAGASSGFRQIRKKTVKESSATSIIPGPMPAMNSAPIEVSVMMP